MSDLKLLFAGDAVVDASTTQIAVGSNLKNIIGRCDLVSCNFEAPIKVDGAFAITKAGPAIFQQRNAIAALRGAGFNFFNLSNNHILDYGGKSCLNTIEELKDGASAGAGTFEQCYSYKLLNLKGIRVALLSLSEWGFGVLDDANSVKGEIGYAWVGHPLVEDLIRKAKNEADIVIAQLHAGVEDISVPWPEWRNIYRRIIDWGCDLIIAHHPHVPQGYETYKNKKIFYSLGNFYFDMASSHPLWNKSYCVEVDIVDRSITGTTVHWTEKKGASIETDNNKQTSDLEAELCSNLQEPKYTELVNKYTQELWRDRYSGYYTQSFNTLTRKFGLKYNFQVAMKYLFGRDKTQNELLLHNIAIESHRFVAERFLKDTWKKNAHLASSDS
ncbi:MAG TPA: CapA family protein [Cyclobacteriaceae bacterium]|nr:CapA family protein [Cyclobacteriaceae bacterium]